MLHTATPRFIPLVRSTIIYLALFGNISYTVTIIPFSVFFSDHLPNQINLDRTPTLPSLSSNFSVDWCIYTQILNDAPPPLGVLNYNDDIVSYCKSYRLNQKRFRGAKCHHAPRNYQDLPKEIKIEINTKNRLQQLWEVFREPNIHNEINHLSATIIRDIERFKNNK